MVPVPICWLGKILIPVHIIPLWIVVVAIVANLVNTWLPPVSHIESGHRLCVHHGICESLQHVKCRRLLCRWQGARLWRWLLRYWRLRCRCLLCDHLLDRYLMREYLLHGYLWCKHLLRGYLLYRYL